MDFSRANNLHMKRMWYPGQKKYFLTHKAISFQGEVLYNLGTYPLEVAIKGPKLQPLQYMAPQWYYHSGASMG